MQRGECPVNLFGEHGACQLMGEMSLVKETAGSPRAASTPVVNRRVLPLGTRRLGPPVPRVLPLK